VRAHHPVEGALRGELVGRSLERRAGHRRDLPGDLFAEPGRGVQPGPDGGPAHGHLQQAPGGVLDLGDRVVEGADVAGPLLADGQGSGVLQVRPADLDHVRPLSRLPLYRVAEPA
jgi:hypothetical protein